MKTLICIPCLDQVNTSFVRTLLSVQPVGDIQFAFTQSSLIYDARNILAVQAITGGYDRTLWFDSDMVLPSDIMVRLSETMDKGYDLVSGLYFTRKPPYRPVVYDGCRVFEKDGQRQCAAICFDEYPENSVFEIEACGFGGVMVSTKLLNDVREKYGLPFSPISGFGEDLSFCIRAHSLGAKMVCDSSAKMGHCGTHIITEETFKENKQCLQK